MGVPLSFSAVTVTYASVRALEAVTASFGEGLNVVPVAAIGVGWVTVRRWFSVEKVL